MEFRGISFAPQSYEQRTISSFNMSDPGVYSYPLMGHLEHQRTLKSWSVPQLSKPQLTMASAIHFLVGGFVGSKSQRNVEKCELFPIGKLIGNCLQEKKSRDSSQTPSLVTKVMTELFKVASSPPMQSFHVPESKLEDMACSSIPQCVAEVENCVNKAMRLLSECSLDSNDSDFIVFEGNDDADCSNWIDYSDSEDEDFEWQQQMDLEAASIDNNISKANAKWNLHYGGEISTPAPNCKVTFDPKPRIKVMRVWTHAHQAARKSNWEQIGRDRVRFKDHILGMEKILGPVLTSEHRQRVWKSLQDAR